MKLYLLILLYFFSIYSVFANDLDGKGLICKSNVENQKLNDKFYWFFEGQVYKVWFDKKKNIITKSTYPAFYKLTEGYIRFYRIFVLLDTLDFTDKNNNILGQCEFLDSYIQIENLIELNLK
jgi:hypothetical protein